MLTLAKISIRRPKTMLAVWLLVAAGLTLIGLGVSKSLSPTITVVPGTQSARAERLAGAQFGPTSRHEFPRRPLGGSHGTDRDRT